MGLDRNGSSIPNAGEPLVDPELALGIEAEPAAPGGEVDPRQAEVELEPPQRTPPLGARRRGLREPIEPVVFRP